MPAALDTATAVPTPKSRLDDRRSHRRHAPAATGVKVARTDFERDDWGHVVDLSAGGCQLRTNDPTIRPGDRLEVRLSLPDYAGIRPFTRRADGTAIEPTSEWTGTIEIARRTPNTDDAGYTLGGRLIDMAPVDRGLLGLYLSTQPLAA